MSLYAWPRYVDLPTSLLSLSAGGVTIESNAVAGEALWHWSHAGVQYINNRDYGRAIQSALFFADRNPTEAGNTWSDLSRPSATRRGSPVLTCATWAQPKSHGPYRWNGTPRTFRDRERTAPSCARTRSLERSWSSTSAT